MSLLWAIGGMVAAFVGGVLVGWLLASYVFMSAIKGKDSDRRGE